MIHPILNRAGRLPEDGWHQIEVPGEHINHDAKSVQVIDAKAIDSLVNRFKQDAKAENFAGVLVDRDHFSLDQSQSSEAMGWAMELRNRGGIPEARVEWTAAGRPLIESKPGQPPTYKFFSTVYEPADQEVLGTQIVNGAKYKRVRPLHLSRLALTNDPNNAGAKPISNRNGNPASADDENKDTPTMKSLLKKLGLAEDASEESAVAALQTIQNRAAQIEPLTKERDELLAAQVEADLDKHAAKITNREAVKAQLIANRKGTLALLDAMKAPEEKKEEPARLTNRAGAKVPGTEKTDAEKNAAEAARAQRISNRAYELQATAKQNGRRLSHTDAFRDATAEVDAAAAK